jgi:very-short-patch-repair endonuclease
MAVWETGEKVAALDGVSALQFAGLEHYADDVIHVSVVHTCSVKTLPGVRLHKVVRRVPGELMGAGIARTRPAVAALRGAYWAVSDRQAALILVMTVQQRLATPEQLIGWSQRLRGRKRRRFVRLVLSDLAHGVQSLGELDFAAMCRRRGLPEPSRQVVMRGPRGRIYLDVRWDRWSLVVEIDGAQHRQGLQVTMDNLRQNAVILRQDTLLRIDVIGLRLCEDEFMDQVAMGLGRISKVS